MQPIKDKFVLLFCPQPTQEGRRMAPLGLVAISTFLDQQGYDIRIFHSYDKQDYLEALNHLDKAICVGITSMTGYQIYDGLKFAKLVRDKNPEVPIIWGGVHPTIKPVQTVKHPLVDIVVKGQGEDIFTELVKCLDKGKSYKYITGITYMQGGQVIDNPNRPQKNISEYPALPYHVLGDSIKRYIKKTPYANRSLHYITSFGCPFRCAFCYLATPTFTRKWDPYPVKRVLDEIEYLVKTYDLDGIDIRDANFFVNHQRVIDICQGLVDRKINIALSGANGRAEQMIKYTPDEWKLFQQAGIKEILVGAESGDQEMLDLINKQCSVADALECEKMAKEHNINIINSFITSYPPQTDNPQQRKKVLKRELDKTVDLLRDIFKVNPNAITLLFFYTPYPGTPLYDLSVQRGFKDPSNLEEWCGIDLAHQVTPWTSKKHVNKVLLLRVLLALKKITSREYTQPKKGWKDKIFKSLGLYTLLQAWVDIRLKHKFYFFPFERALFSINKLIK